MPPSILTSSLFPADESTGLDSYSVTFSWLAEDPNQGDTLTYDLFLGETDPPHLFAAGLTATNSRAGDFIPGNIYYWKIVVRDQSGLTGFSPVFTLSTVFVDSDADGLRDGEEIEIYGTDPTLADTDGDGINDGNELAYWGDQWKNDFDGDGLINLLDSDSDNDGIDDGDEIAAGTDPGWYTYLQLPAIKLLLLEE